MLELFKCLYMTKICESAKYYIAHKDEFSGDNLCTGYLKSSGVEICILPFDMCSCFPPCPKSDGENMYHVEECPERCQCVGYSAPMHFRDDNLLYILIILTENLRSYFYTEHFWFNVSPGTVCLLPFVGHTALSNISNYVFSGLHEVRWLDMIGGQLDYASRGLYRV